MMGKITPPKLDPPATMPMAKARLLKNHVVTEFIATYGQSVLCIGRREGLTWVEQAADSNRTTYTFSEYELIVLRRD